MPSLAGSCTSSLPVHPRGMVDLERFPDYGRANRETFKKKHIHALSPDASLEENSQKKNIHKHRDIQYVQRGPSKVRFVPETSLMR